MTVQVVTENTTVQNVSADEQYTGITDTGLNSGSPTTNFSNPTTLAMNESSDFWLISIDLSNLPVGATISDAQLYMYMDNGFQTTFDWYAHRCLRDWVVNEATWNIYSTGNNWGTAGGLNTTSDHNSTAVGTVSVANSAGWYNVDITSWVQDVYSSTITNQGLWMRRGDGGGGSNYRVFRTANYTDGSRPEVAITYTTSSGSLLTHKGMSGGMQSLSGGLNA